jgi:hypothetical protein
MRLGSRTKKDYRFYINLFSITLILLIVYILTKHYIDQEQFIYSWDYSGYQKNTNILIEEFRKSFMNGILELLASLFSDYSKIYCLPILPIYLAFGSTRFAFILSFTLVYLVSFSLIMGLVFSKLVHGNRWIAFWLTTFITLLTPAAWISLLRGYPDTGGASLYMLGILLYWKDTSLKQKKQALQISGLMAFLVLFRRHFAYAFRSFIITIALQNLIQFLLSKINKRLEYKLNPIFITKRIGLLLLLFLVFSIHLLVKIFYFNYRELYASYEEPTLRNLEYYGSSFGWLFIILAAVGYLISLSNQNVNRERLSFIALLGSVTTLQWIFSSKQLGLHYINHFLPFVILGLSSLVWSTKHLSSRIQIKNHTAKILIAPIIFLLIINFSISQGNLQWNTAYSRLFFARVESPLIRSDLPELTRFINYLRDNSKPEESTYVAASSYEMLNKSIIEEAEKHLYKKQILNIIRTSDIDSRDFYPLNGLLEAHYVAITNPIQYHINPAEQKVITIINEIFNQQDFIANDFKKVPEQFTLDRGVTVSLYERVKATSMETALDTLAFMKERIKGTLGRETFWINLSPGNNTVIERDALFKTVHISPLFVKTNNPVSLLFFGEIPPKVKIEGIINIMSDCAKTKSIEIELSTLNSSKVILDKKSILYTPKNKENFSVTLNGQNSKFISLNLESQNKDIDQNTCKIALNHIVVLN